MFNMGKIKFFIPGLLLLACGANSVKLFTAGRLDEAYRLSRQEFAQDSTNVAALLVTGKVYYARSILDSAEMTFELATEKFPGNQAAISELIQVKKELVLQDVVAGNDQKVLEKFQEIIRLDANDRQAIAGIGDIYRKKGQLEKARVQYLAAMALDSTDANTQEKIQAIDAATDSSNDATGAGHNFLEKNNYQMAEASFANALKIKPDNTEAKYGLHLARGLWLYKRGDIGELWEAISQFGQASALKPERAEPHYHMARAYEKKDSDEFDNAIQEYEIALQLEPEGKFARQCSQKSKELRALQRRLLDFWGKPKRD